MTTFPRGKVYDLKPEDKGKQKESTFYDCIPYDRNKKEKKKYGYWCPTELNEKGKWKKKGICKTYGPPGSVKPTTNQTQKMSKPDIVSNKPTKKSSNKPDIVSNKPDIVSNKPDIVSNKPGIVSNVSDIWGVDYKFDNYRKVPIKSSKVKTGKCIFPFKYKKQLHNECVDDPINKDTFCATEVNKRGTLLKSGRCLPKNRTPAQMDIMIEAAKEVKRKDTKRYGYTIKKKAPSNNSNTLSKKMSKIRLNANNWISKRFGDGFLINEDIDRRGDCFFDCIHTALGHIGINKSIKELRTIVRDNLTQDNFDLYKELYNNAVNDGDENIMLEMDFISDLDTLPDLRNLVLTNKYWADMLAMSHIEKELKLKVILFDEEMYKRGRIDNIINCGNNLDKFSIVKCSICGVTSTKNEKIKQDEFLEQDIIPYLKGHGVDIDAVSD
jgi:hypothetical protein